ncbi:lasso peptide [Nostoc sp. CCY0012]|uniref:lasso peptide n=1 Tax=Nostoc sp. CCY0012 TaxID=1056123 RepID=UPI0039C617D9
MKKQYHPPKISIHGNVEAITQAIGSDVFVDVVFFNGSPLFSIQGTSDIDGEVVPINRQ